MDQEEIIWVKPMCWLSRKVEGGMMDWRKGGGTKVRGLLVATTKAPTWVGTVRS